MFFQTAVIVFFVEKIPDTLNILSKPSLDFLSLHQSCEYEVQVNPSEGYIAHNLGTALYITLSSCVLAKMHQIPLMLVFALPLACVCFIPVCSSLKPAVCVYSTWFIPAPGEQAAGSWPVTSHPLCQTHTVAARTWVHMEPGHFQSTDMHLPACWACTRCHLFHLFQLCLTSCACVDSTCAYLLVYLLQESRPASSRAVAWHQRWENWQETSRNGLSLFQTRLFYQPRFLGKLSHPCSKYKSCASCYKTRHPVVLFTVLVGEHVLWPWNNNMKTSYYVDLFFFVWASAS